MGSHNFKRNIKLIIEYDGSAYAGWQRLKAEINVYSIQSIIEETLSNLLKEKIEITASGRTDAGVHALGQVTNFHTDSTCTIIDLKKELNNRLPEDIKIKDIEEVDINFHSRYHAKAKTYEYRIDQSEKQRVFTRKYTYHYPVFLDIKAMEAAAAFLIGTHDFRAFSTWRKGDKSTVRTIENIRIYKYNEREDTHGELRIAITGDGFLYNMVRIIVGTLLEVGEGKKDVAEIKKILESKERWTAGKTVYPNGLFLLSVRY